MSLHAFNHIAFHALLESLKTFSAKNTRHTHWTLMPSANPLTDPIVIRDDNTDTFHVIFYGLKDMNWKSPFTIEQYDATATRTRKRSLPTEHRYYILNGYQTLKNIQFDDRNQPFDGDAMTECMVVELQPPVMDKFVPFKSLKNFKLKFTDNGTSIDGAALELVEVTTESNV